jgi:hypothetical protein
MVITINRFGHLDKTIANVNRNKEYPVEKAYGHKEKYTELGE